MGAHRCLSLSRWISLVWLIGIAGLPALAAQASEPLAPPTALVCGGSDPDGDGVGSDCDNCLATYNPGQENSDTDAAGDACDCAPLNDGSFSLPGEVTNLTMGVDGMAILWDSAVLTGGPGTVHDVVRGRLDELPVGMGPSEICLVFGLPDATTADADALSPGQGFWYLVRGRNDCGAGIYGMMSDGTVSVSAACPFVPLADLVETVLSDPPAEIAAGGTFSVTDTALNQGAATAAASATAYYLSLDTLKDVADTPMAGSRVVASLSPGQTSSGTTEVSVPLSITAGTFFLLACADDAGGVEEIDELNNCRSSAGPVLVHKPDLVQTAVSDPPVAAAAGLSFSVTDTAQNAGTAAAGSSSTGYYLSLDTLRDGADILMTGTRAVPALADGATSTGSATVTIPVSAAAGLYFLLACADDAGAVSETDETNNCLASAAQMDLRTKDLAQISVTNPPASVTTGSSFPVTDTVQNVGTGSVVSTVTRYYFSVDSVKDGADLVSGSRSVPPLTASGSSTGGTTIFVPTAAAGTYFLLACADDQGAVTEHDETNNCLASVNSTQVLKPDLVETAVSDPPATTSPGSSFSVTDTAQNVGTGNAGSSTTRYYLSLDAVKDVTDTSLGGGRPVGPLAAGATSTATVTVSLAPSTAAGTYFLLACSDDFNGIAEIDETNNCLASAAQTEVILPDLAETAVSDPPASLSSGSGFPVTDTVQNLGTVTAASSITRYYLSLDTVKGGGDTLLTGGRSVPPLSAGATSTATVTVTVPASAAAGTFFLLACAEDGLSFMETDETNNCLASTGQALVSVTADMTETAVSDPPANIGPGQSFSVTDTAQNVGSGSTVTPTTTRYYLSLDTVKDAGDTLLSGSRPVAPLAAGATSTGTIMVTVPVATNLGSYFLLACADDLNALGETNEANNCLASTGQTQVARPDLVETALSDPPASLSPGASFSVTDTVQNVGAGAAGGFSIRYYLSLDTVKDGADASLSGSRFLFSLAAGATSTATLTVALQTNAAAGTFFLLACADDPGNIPETDETNNCRASAGQTVVILPDLTQTAVSDPPLTVAAGSSFSITDTVENLGPGSAPNSSTLYYLSLDQLRDAADTLLSGGRGVPPLASGGTSTGMTTVTVSSGTDTFSYFLLACADGGGMSTITESDETNNCIASAGKVQVVILPDLVVSAVTNPPAVAAGGLSFPVTDTVQNVGTGAAGACSTRYYLSLNSVKDGADILLVGIRSVPALPGGSSSTGSLSLTIPSATAAGTYLLLACADDTEAVLESNESNNCRASLSPMQLRQPDLVATLRPPVPTSVAPGGTFSITDTALNQGDSASGASTTRYYFSADTVKDGADVLLTGTRAVPALAAGASFMAGATLTVPPSTPVGSYFLLLCADDLGAVAESDETNNCQPSSTQILVAVPSTDLVETAVTDPPASTSPGSGFSVTDTAQNAGTGTTGFSTTRYYLSVDALKDGADILLSGTRSVGPLAAGATSSGTVTVNVPSSSAAGTYFLLACADDLNAVAEANEANNCLASVGQVQVILPDLTETAVSDPPASVSPPSGFAVTDTVQNLGTVSAPGSTTRYYLSLDTAKDGADTLLSGGRSVPPLSAGATSTATVTVSVPSSAAAGTYFLMACADDLNVIGETSEANNCLTSTGQVQVVVTADMTETAVSDPPASSGPGLGFSVTDTAQNVGSGATGVSTTTRYYLSLDAVKDGADTLLSGTRLIAPLAAGATSTGTITVTVPVATTAGTYFLLACADDLGNVGETNEANNCLASVGQTQLARPDLVETALSDPPASISSGVGFSVTDTVQNVGAGPAGSSATIYYLSLDTVKDGADPPLSGGRSVPPLSAGATSTATVTVSVPSSAAAGTYFLLACADGGMMGSVTETDETNNCIASAGQTQVILSDLTQTAVSDPPASLAAGSGFSVTDTAQNLGPGGSPSSNTRYYLSLDQLKDAADTLLTGGRFIPPLASGATSTGTTTVTIPIGADAFSYFLLACADDLASVQETDETNNCIASTNRVQVIKPDLVETAVTDPPASISAGSGFSVTDTVFNQGAASSGSSTTRYYLSPDATRSATDLLMTGGRLVPALAASASSTATVTVTVPLGSPPGTYFLLACADDTQNVQEQIETNNCRASTGQVTVN